MTAPQIVIDITTRGAQAAQSGIDRVTQRLDRLQASVQKASHYGAGLGVVLGTDLVGRLGGAAGAIVRQADAMTSMTSRLALLTGGVQAAMGVQDQLYAVAQRSRQGFTDLADTYSGVYRAGEALNLSQREILTVTEAVANAMALSGGAADSQRAALIQLNQGLASGVLRGEELNSVMEQSPRLARALADGLNVPIGKLREMGKEGELTAQRVIEALQRAAPGLARELASSTLTVGQGMTLLSNSATRLIGDLDRASGASAAAARLLGSVATSLDSVGDAVRRNETAVNLLFGATAGVGLAAAIGALGRFAPLITGIGSAIAANPVVATVLGVGAVAGATAVGLAQLADEKTPLAGKLKELQRAREHLQRNQQLGRGDTSPGAGLLPINQALTKRIAELEGEITVLQSQAASDFRRRELTEANRNSGPFPDAKPIEEVRKYAKLDLDAKREWAEQAIEIAKSYNQRIALYGDPDGSLARERDRRLIEGQRELQDKIKPKKTLQEEADELGKAAGFAILEDFDKVYKRYVDDLGKSVEQETTALEESSGNHNAWLQRLQQDADELPKRLAELQAGLIPDARARGQALIEMERQQLQERLDLFVQYGRDVGDAQDRLNDYIATKQADLNEQLKPQWQRMAELWADTLRDMAQRKDEFLTGFVDRGRDAFAEFLSTGRLSTRSLTDFIRSEFARLAYERFLSGYVRSAANFIFDAFLGGGSGGGTSGGGEAMFGNLISLDNLPGRAGGGVVQAGGVYRVGERGPETLFIGSRSGVVKADGGASAGGISIVQHFSIRGDESPGRLRELANMVKHETMAAIADQRKRGAPAFA